MPEDHLFDPRRPFSRAEARRAGITDSELLGARYRKLMHDSYISADVVVTLQVKAAAALAASPSGSHISHDTAAELWGGVVPRDPDVHVSNPRGTHRSRRAGIRSHLASSAAETRVLHGQPVSTPPQAFLDMASRLSLVDLVVLGDSLVLAGAVTVEELRAAAWTWHGYGAHLARRVASLVRTGVESPMETRLRMLIVLAGLPQPDVNVTITSRDGRRRYRLDLSYLEWMLSMEYEGRQHAESRDQWAKDIRRREDLDDLGIRNILVVPNGIYVEPGETLRRIVAAVRSRGVASFKPTSDEWRRHFPGRGQRSSAA